MGEPNWKNRTLFHGDNLDFMRSMHSETIDLVATDPPFNKSRDFHATPDSLGAGGSFQDRWRWDEDVHRDWTDQLENDQPKLLNVIENARFSHSDSMAAYLCFMAVRLLEMHRLLKPSGSIFLHCDPTASHYLKMVMDAIFGVKNFQNEIVWCYTDPAGRRNTAYYKRTHDCIFWYAKSRRHCQTFELHMAPLAESTIKRYGKYFDERGQISYSHLKDTNPGVFLALKGVPDDLDQVWMDRAKGTVAGDWWTDIPPIRRKGGKQKAREKVMWPTQKPLQLYSRIINSVTCEGDIVMDPFCGCATTCVAAEILGRQWVGIDIWKDAPDVVRARLEAEGLHAPKYTRRSSENKRIFLFKEDFEFTSVLPERVDDEEVVADRLPTLLRKSLASWERMSNGEIRKELVNAQKDSAGWVICAGCGRQLESEFMQLDHINPKSGTGKNDLSNRILLCGPCNGKKSDTLTLQGLRKRNRKDGWMTDETAAEAAALRAHSKYIEVRNRDL